MTNHTQRVKGRELVSKGASLLGDSYKVTTGKAGGNLEGPWIPTPPIHSKPIMLIRYNFGFESFDRK